jgi:hypothetical protein
VRHAWTVDPTCESDLTGRARLDRTRRVKALGTGWFGGSRGALAACALSLGTAGIGLLLAPPAEAVTSSQIVAVINAERVANGLPQVTEDRALSAGCADYDNYRRINGGFANAFTPGAEKPGMPGYTPAGARASHDSLLNAGDRPGDSWANGDVFDDAPGHLQALMDPAVAVIGADQLDFELGIYGTSSLSCVDVRSAPGRQAPKRLRAYAYKGRTGKIPVNPPAYREGPRATGSIVFLYFFAPKRVTLTLRSLKITDSGGAMLSPSYLGFSGGIIDGRRPARTANSASPSKTDTITEFVPLATEPGSIEDHLDEQTKLQERKTRHLQNIVLNWLLGLVPK